MIPKFRAFIIAEKRHLSVVLIDFCDKIVWCSNENNPTVKIDINRVFNFDEIILEQFTGLRDATKWKDLTESEREQWTRAGNMPSEWKGREIYEGDKVEFTTGWQSKHQIGVVFDREQAQFGFGREYEGDLSCIYTDKSLGYFLDATEGCYTVIGHVHESEGI